MHALLHYHYHLYLALLYQLSTERTSGSNSLLKYKKKPPGFTKALVEEYTYEQTFSNVPEFYRILQQEYIGDKSDLVRVCLQTFRVKNIKK